MSTYNGLRLTPQEAIARDRIMERVAARHRAERRSHPSRTALLLRSIADRLDHGEHEPAERDPRSAQPRPWSPSVRRAPHRHS